MIKDKKSLKGSKTPSRRKFFKAAAATGAAAATAVAMPNVAFGVCTRFLWCINHKGESMFLTFLSNILI